MDDLTVGNDGALGQLTSFAQAPADVARTLLVTGDYGHGKSHYLGALRQLSLKSGLATCYMSADGWANALNHPQRFLPLLFATLDVPHVSATGYRDFLYNLLLEPSSARGLLGVLKRHFEGHLAAERACTDDLQRLLLVMGDPDAVDVAGLRASVSGYLTGESYRHRGATPDIRIATYRLIRICTDLVRSVGATGLLLLVDEAESIFTKLPTMPSRYGAFRVLSALSHGRHLPNCKVAIGLTPDAVRWTAAGAPEFGRDPRAVTEEPVRRFLDDFARGEIPELRCGHLTAKHRRALLERVRAVHERALDWCLADGHEAEWDRLAEKLVEQASPLRILVRTTVDFLDTKHCGL